MKKMRKIIPAFAMLMVAAIMMSTASFAWFSMGTTATATGMQIEATADSSLVISLEATLDEFLIADASVELGAQNIANGIAPATHDDARANKLKAIGNANAAVDAGTGKVTGTADWIDAVEGTHYVEYTVYIASAGGAMEKDLKVTLDVVEATKNLHNALTIDFWVSETKTAPIAYVGSLNVENAKSATPTTLTLSSADIPQAVLDSSVDPAQPQVLGDYFTVVMRVYFDGDLADAAKTGYNYVRNAMVTEVLVKLGLDFIAE